jgi:hypothetical protein
MISAFPPDLAEFLPSTGPLLPDLQGLYSQIAKVELDRTLALPVPGHIGIDPQSACRLGYHVSASLRPHQSKETL